MGWNLKGVWEGAYRQALSKSSSRRNHREAVFMEGIMSCSGVRPWNQKSRTDCNTAGLKACSSWDLVKVVGVVVLVVASEEAPWVSSAVTGLVLCHVHAVSARHDIGAEEGDLILDFLCEVALVKTEDSNGWFHFHSCRVNSWKSEVCRGKEVSD